MILIGASFKFSFPDRDLIFIAYEQAYPFISCMGQVFNWMTFSQTSEVSEMVTYYALFGMPSH